MMTELSPVPPLQYIGIELTNRCNLRCQHCFNCSGEGALQELALAEVVNIFDQLRQMGTTRLRLSGGEPTLHPDFLSIVAEAQRRDLHISLNTNGLFSGRLREQIAELPIVQFLVSLDGLRVTNDFIRGRGTFDRVVDTIAWLLRHGREVIISVHLYRTSVEDVEGLIALSANLGAAIKFSPIRPVGRAQENSRDLILTPEDFYLAVQTITRLRRCYPAIRISTDFDLLRPVNSSEAPALAFDTCPAGRSILNVNYDGYVYPCIFLATPQHELADGHIREKALSELWQTGPMFQRFRALTRDAECQQCFAYRRTCNGGCPAMAYLSTGRLEAHDPQCFARLISRSDL